MKHLIVAALIMLGAGSALADPMQNPALNEIQRGQDQQNASMADRGILTSKRTRDRIRWLEEKDDDIVARYNDVEAISRKLHERGFHNQANELDKVRDQLKRLRNDLPKRNTSGTFLTDLNDFFSDTTEGAATRGRKGKTVGRMIDDLSVIDTQLNELADAVGVERTKLTREREKGEARDKVDATAEGGGTAKTRADKGTNADEVAGGANGMDAVAGFVIEVEGVVGEVEFLINGKIATAGPTYKSSDGTYEIRAIALTPTRNRSRDFKPSKHTYSFDYSDHFLEYKVQSGNFDGWSRFSVERETYRWTFMAEADEASQFVKSSGVHKAVTKDVIVIKPLKGGRRVALTASGEAVWKQESNRKADMPKLNETAGGTLNLVFIPVVR